MVQSPWPMSMNANCMKPSVGACTSGEAVNPLGPNVRKVLILRSRFLNRKRSDRESRVGRRRPARPPIGKILFAHEYLRVIVPFQEDCQAEGIAAVSAGWQLVRKDVIAE